MIKPTSDTMYDFYSQNREEINEYFKDNPERKSKNWKNHLENLYSLYSNGSLQYQTPLNTAIKEKLQKDNM